ncbi:MAG: alpha/beta fold hydrolase [Candidatus Babeliales bacterium]
MKHIKHIAIASLISTATLIAFDAPARVYIVVHGTWASKESWSKPGGKFFNDLAASAHQFNAHVVSFSWSGKLDNKSRALAGKELAKFIQHYSPDTPICVVAHSHGANVGILASHELAKLKSSHIIDKFYALAPPVNEVDYMPNMHIINHFYNLFSLQDYVQPVLGIFGRVYPEHPRIANIRIGIEGKQGSHSELHDPIIGRWIPYIHEQLCHHAMGNFDQFSFVKPGYVFFFVQETPYYKEDSNRIALLKYDRELTERVANALSRSKQENSYGRTGK